MNKSDMKNGMRVKIRNGNMYIYMDGRLLRKEGWLDFEEDYTDFLACRVGRQWEIVAIWATDNSNIDENWTTGEPIYSVDAERKATLKAIKEGEADLRVLQQQLTATGNKLQSLRQKLEEL